MPSLTPCRASQADVKAQCSKAKPHGGKVQQCLRKHKSKLHWDCRAQLFADAKANQDDIRLSTMVFENCLDDKRKVLAAEIDCQVCWHCPRKTSKGAVLRICICPVHLGNVCS